MNQRLSSLRLACAVLVVAASVLSSAPTALAGEVVVPSAVAGVEGNWNNGFPFNIGYWQIPTMRYQQVYGAADWSSVAEPVLITEIRFRKDGAFNGGFNSVLPDVQINLSTTIFAPDQLTRTFEENVGDDDTIVYDGALALSSPQTPRDSVPDPFDIVIRLQKPFLYDPARGNLLLEVRNYGSGLTTFFDSHVATDQTSVSSTFAGGSVDSPTADFTYTGGLVTQFAFVPALIPVPFDVKPGDDSNLVRLKAGGGNSSNGKGKSAPKPNLLETAILSSDAFDASDVDSASLRLGDPDLSAATAPVATRLADVDADGDLDLVADFDVGAMVEAGAISLDTAVLAVSGYAVYGSRIEGADLVRVRR